MNKDDFGHAPVETPLRRPAGLGQRTNLLDQRLQGMLTLVNGHDDRDRVLCHGSLVDCGHGSKNSGGTRT